MPNHSPILIGNAFPLSLARQPVSITPVPLATLRRALRTRQLLSFWGHANTLAAANAVLGHDLTPASERPALTLTPAGLPTLAGHTFRECWILSPNYAPGFRPNIATEVTPAQISGWQLLRLRWQI